MPEDPQQQLSIEDFAKRIKDKHPEYADMDNLELAKRIASTYPEYLNNVKLPPVTSEDISNAAHNFGLNITSGKRSPAEQQRLIKEGKTKATNSFHLYGQAFDVTGDRVGEFRDYIRKLYGYGLSELIDEKNHTHVAWQARGDDAPATSTLGAKKQTKAQADLEAYRQAQQAFAPVMQTRKLMEKAGQASVAAQMAQAQKAETQKIRPPTGGRRMPVTGEGDYPDQPMTPDQALKEMTKPPMPSTGEGGGPLYQGGWRQVVREAPEFVEKHVEGVAKWWMISPEGLDAAKKTLEFFIPSVMQTKEEYLAGKHVPVGETIPGQLAKAQISPLQTADRIAKERNLPWYEAMIDPEVMGHAGLALIPGIGPMASQFSTLIKEGNYSDAADVAIAMVVPFAWHEVRGAMSEGKLAGVKLEEGKKGAPITTYDDSTKTATINKAGVQEVVERGGNPVAAIDEGLRHEGALDDVVGHADVDKATDPIKPGDKVTIKGVKGTKEVVDVTDTHVTIKTATGTVKILKSKVQQAAAENLKTAADRVLPTEDAEKFKEDIDSNTNINRDNKEAYDREEKVVEEASQTGEALDTARATATSAIEQLRAKHPEVAAHAEELASQRINAASQQVVDPQTGSVLQESRFLPAKELQQIKDQAIQDAMKEHGIGVEADRKGPFSIYFPGTGTTVPIPLTFQQARTSSAGAKFITTLTNIVREVVGVSARALDTGIGVHNAIGFYADQPGQWDLNTVSRFILTGDSLENIHYVIAKAAKESSQFSTIFWERMEGGPDQVVHVKLPSMSDRQLNLLMETLKKHGVDGGTFSSREFIYADVGKANLPKMAAAMDEFMANTGLNLEVADHYDAKVTLLDEEQYGKIIDNYKAKQRGEVPEATGRSQEETHISGERPKEGDLRSPDSKTAEANKRRLVQDTGPIQLSPAAQANYHTIFNGVRDFVAKLPKEAKNRTEKMRASISDYVADNFKPQLDQLIEELSNRENIKVRPAVKIFEGGPDVPNVWLLIWRPMEGTTFPAEGTSIHGHGPSHAAIRVYRGTITENMYYSAKKGRQRVAPVDGENVIILPRELPETSSFTVNAPYVHDVVNNSGELAVTIHTYDSPLHRMEGYSVTPDGRIIAGDVWDESQGPSPEQLPIKEPTPEGSPEGKAELDKATKINKEAENINKNMKTADIEKELGMEPSKRLLGKSKYKRELSKRLAEQRVNALTPEQASALEDVVARPGAKPSPEAQTLLGVEPKGEEPTEIASKPKLKLPKEPLPKLRTTPPTFSQNQVVSTQAFANGASLKIREVTKDGFIKAVKLSEDANPNARVYTIKVDSPVGKDLKLVEGQGQPKVEPTEPTPTAAPTPKVESVDKIKSSMTIADMQKELGWSDKEMAVFRKQNLTKAGWKTALAKQVAEKRAAETQATPAVEPTEAEPTPAPPTEGTPTLGKPLAPEDVPTPQGPKFKGKKPQLKAEAPKPAATPETLDISADIAQLRSRPHDTKPVPIPLSGGRYKLKSESFLSRTEFSSLEDAQKAADHIWEESRKRPGEVRAGRRSDTEAGFITPRLTNLMSLGLAKFVQRDLGGNVITRGARIGQELINFLVPRHGVPKIGLDIMSKMRGQRAYAEARLGLWGKEVKKAFEKAPQAENIEFMDRMKRGLKQATSDLDDIVGFYRTLEDKVINDINTERAKAGLDPVPYLENHFRIFWKEIPGAPPAPPTTTLGKIKAFILPRRPVSGTKGFLKKHTLVDVSEGIAKGGVPVSYNPQTLMELSYADSYRYLTALRMWNQLKDYGLREFVKTGRDIPEGFRPISDPIAQVYFRTKPGLVKAGQWVVEDNVARILENHLSRDKIRESELGKLSLDVKNTITMSELGLSGFHGLFEWAESSGSEIGLGLRQLVNVGFLQGKPSYMLKGGKSLIKGVTGTSAGFSSRLGGSVLRYIADPAEFIKTSRGQSFIKAFPDASHLINDLFEGGGQVKMSDAYRTHWRESMKEEWKEGNWPGASLIRAPLAGVEALMKPLFEEFIPRLKLGTYLEEYSTALVENEKALSSGRMTRTELARKTWDFIEDRFGEMNYDNLYWNNTFKTSMQVGFRSVTWQLGNLRATAGALPEQLMSLGRAAKYGEAPRIAPKLAWIAGMSLNTVLISSLITKVTTGKYPWELAKDAKDLLLHIIYPRISATDPTKRIATPTYWKAAAHFAHDPKGYTTATISSPVHQVIDLWTNKDFFGNWIYNPKDPLQRKVMDGFKYVFPTPFSVESFKSAMEKGAPKGEALTGFMGISKAPSYIREPGRTAVFEKKEQQKQFIRRRFKALRERH